MVFPSNFSTCVALQVLVPVGIKGIPAGCQERPRGDQSHQTVPALKQNHQRDKDGQRSGPGRRVLFYWV